MTIILFLITRILLIAALAAFIVLTVKTKSFKESLAILIRGFKRGLQGTGLFLPHTSKKIELYRWIPDKNRDVCEASRECAECPPMDLADWMETGYPKSPDADEACHEDCKCKLVCIKTHALN